MIRSQHKELNSMYSFSIPLVYYNKDKRSLGKKKGDVKSWVKIRDPKVFFSPVFIPYLADKTSIQIYFGGAGSGKSVFVARRTIIDLLMGKRNFLVVRKVFGTLRQSFYTELEKAACDMGLEKYFNFTVSPLEVSCKTTGRKAIFRGLDKAEKIKSITAKRGIITDIIMEEATELTEPDYDLLETRLRGICDVKKRITILFNPIHQGHWLYKRFFIWKEEGVQKEVPDDAVLVRYDSKFSYTDPNGGNPKRVNGIRSVLIHKTNHWNNNFLAPEDRELYESWAEINPHKYNVYCLGNWGVLGDLIFTNWEIRDLSGVAHQFDQLYDGFDFGWFPDPHAYVVCGLRGNVIYVFLEETGRKALTKDIVAQIQPHCGSRDIYCDTNELRTLAELKEYNLNVHPVAKWPGNNETAIAWFRNYTIVIDYRCTMLISQMREYSYQKDKNGDTISKPCEGRGKNGHHDCISAMYYAFNYQIQGSRTSVISRH